MMIYLIGYMGSGKTTLGKQLAQHLKYEFIDLDHYIEENNHKAISEIFRDEGEDHFREIEYAYLKDFLNEDDIVLATGGGTPCFFDSMELMNKSGITIYLNMTVDVLISRLKNEKKTRPLISNKTDEELNEFIVNALTARNKYYLQAQYIFTQNNLLPEHILSKVKL